ELSAIFRREQEEPIEPVSREDAAEVLCRRLFAPRSVENREPFLPHVMAALKGIGALDERTLKEGPDAEDRYLRSYPFHPELTDVFYSKWTNLEGFQRTRGVLRTFALALREALHWDDSPLVGPNVFLSRPGEHGLSEAARDLASVASSEEYEGRRQEWSGILLGELDKARDIQKGLPGIQHRELEQAVVAVFLHSQPIGQRASTREVLTLVGAAGPDRIELEQGLIGWAGTSWFLDDEVIGEAQVGPNGARQLPKSWRLGSRPNLIQMHHAARGRVQGQVEDSLLREIGRLKSLTAGASAAGARVHNLPARPADIEDDGEFHFAVLGPGAASDPGRPNPLAEHFLKETTSADRPRVFRNALVLVVPSYDGLEAARSAVCDALAWQEVERMLKGQDVDPTRKAALARFQKDADARVPAVIRQAYCVVVTVDEKGETQAFRVTVDEEKNLFERVKADQRARIHDAPVDAAALLPEGPYDLWPSGAKIQRVKDLAGAFAQYPRLPKMLRRQAIYDTLAQGCRDGLFVLRLTRPDRSTKTYWRSSPDDTALKDPGMELILPEAAQLDEVPPEALAPGILPSLWHEGGIWVQDVLTYFSGHVARVVHEQYEEELPIPRADEKVVYAAIGEAVRRGLVWLLDEPTSLWSEDVPEGILAPQVQLLPPPEPISAIDVLPYSLPDAWQGEESSALAIHEALSRSKGRRLPWPLVSRAIDGALRSSNLELVPGSASWPCGYPS
ncbi:MAG: DUF499 domain-containing protein, partial [Anaerolineae bacterium]|nr:DUF499 domain-containing protein [Anaerolineae bacterium]